MIYDRLKSLYKNQASTIVLSLTNEDKLNSG
jgi:hypothetical protein